MGQIGAPAMTYRHFGGFRLLLASMVVWQHFAADLAPAALADAMAPFAIGNVAVLVFFALSGFVIIEAADRLYRTRPHAFIGNRLLRIMPHFVCAVGLAFVALALFSYCGGERLWRSQPSYPAEMTFTLRNVILNLVGVLPLTDRVISFNVLDIAWAVRVEMAFYLIVLACLAAGLVLPKRNGFSIAAMLSALLLAGPFMLATTGHGIPMLRYLPYFVFGSALYFGLGGSRVAWALVTVAVPAMLWQFITQPADIVVADSPDHVVWVEATLLASLLGLMSYLACHRFSRFRRLDSWLGNLTYPLYLYHEDILILILTFTTGYGYGMFGVGLIGSFVIAWIMTALIDPIVDRRRDALRGVRVGPEPHRVV